MNISPFVCESHDRVTGEVTSSKPIFEGLTFLFGVIYPTPIVLADDFILEHIQLWSKSYRYLILGCCNAPNINWTEMANS